MASIDRTAYPGFVRKYSPEQLSKDFGITKDDGKWVAENAQSASTRLALALQLKSFQHLGYFPDADRTPDEVVDYIRSAMNFGPRINPDFGSSRTTQSRFKERVLSRLGVQPYEGEELRKTVKGFALKAAEVKDSTVDIINTVIETMVMKDIELPSFDILDRLAEEAHNEVERAVIGKIVHRVTPEFRAKALALLDVEFDSRVSAFNALKKSAKRASRDHLDQLIEHLSWLESFGTFEEVFQGVIEPKIRYFGSIAKQLDAPSLKDFQEDKRLVCILCLIKLMQTRTRDQLGEMFLKRMAVITKQAKNILEEKQKKQRSTVEALVITLGGVIKIIQAEDNDALAGRKIRKYVGSAKKIAQMQSEVEEIKEFSNGNYLPFLWERFKSHRAVLFKLIHLINLESTTEQPALMAAIEVIKVHQHSTRSYVDEKLDLSFCTSRWQQLLQLDGVSGKVVDRRQLEVCVFMHIGYALKSGDLAIPGPEEFGDYRKELLPWDECEKLIPDHCERIGVPSTAREFTEWLKQELTREAKNLEQKIPLNSGDVSLDSDGRPMVHKVEAREIPASAIKLREEVIKRMPQREVLECLENIEHWVNFTRHFGPISGNEPKLDDPPKRYLQTAFAMGCGLGPAQASRHLQDPNATAHNLSYANRRHISLEMLERALRELNELYLNLDLPKNWGDGTTVAADGTAYDFFDDNLLAGMHFRYRKTGSVAYRHVSDNYIATFRHFIGPGIWEGVYLIEALMKAGLSVSADTVHADTQGQSATVFTFALLYGVQLHPRIRNWKDLRFLRPTPETVYKYIDKLFSDVADWDLIESGWKDVMQVAMSIAEGKVSSPGLLRKLGSYSRRNKLYFAAKAMGEVIRTIYLLRWIGSIELRREVTANTNKMEAYNGYSKWVSFGGDVITSNDPNEQQKRLRYIDLITSSLLLQTVVDMTRVLRDIRKRRRIRVEDLDFLSPYLTEHILRFGKFEVELDRPKDKWIMEPEFEKAATAVFRLAKKSRR